MIATAASLKARIPFLNIFDGFRTSHELNQVQVIPDDIIRQMIDEKDVNKHRQRALNPEHPIVRGTAQNPDVFFQSREAANQFYTNTPEIVEETMKKFEHSPVVLINCLNITVTLMQNISSSSWVQAPVLYMK